MTNLPGNTNSNSTFIALSLHPKTVSRNIIQKVEIHNNIIRDLAEVSSMEKDQKLDTGYGNMKLSVILYPDWSCEFIEYLKKRDQDFIKQGD